MQKPVNKIEFWKDRLDQSKKDGYLHYSVYLANPTLWKKINDSHKKVIEEHIKPEDNVLDAGCGYGRLSELFDKYLGVDFSPDFIAEARKLYPHKQFIVGDLKDLPLENGQFDWAVLVSIKNMIVGNLGEDEWLKMQKELKRVCKKLLILEYGEMEDYTDTIESISKYEII